MLRKSLVLIALLVLGLGVVGAQAQTATNLTFFLTYIPNIQFAPIYVALEKGYFADAGLNVTLQSGDEPDGINLIAANQLQFGLASGEQVIVARAQDRPVRSVYEWYQKYPIGVLVTNESGIKTPADLKGKQIGIPGLYGASYTGVIALLSANGLTEQDVQLQSIGYNAPQVICVGGVQAAVVYVNNEPLQVQDQIDQKDCGSVTGITVFPVAAAADMVSNGIVTNEETIANHPELVTAFVAAFDHGLRDTIDNPSEAYLLSAKYIDGLPMTDALKAALEQNAKETQSFFDAQPHSTRETMAQTRAGLYEQFKAHADETTLLQFQVLLTSIELWDADQLGYSDSAAWQTTENTLTAMGQLTQSIDVSAAYTNEFLPQATATAPDGTATPEATAAS
ncbi:MAG: ABC transporter substrate-binding protein [Chloroflexota bacterium]